MTNKIIKYQPINPRIAELADYHTNNPEAILEILTTLQGQRGNLEQSAVTDVGRAINIPPSNAFGVASFYSMLNLKEQAGNIIRVCDGPVCWLCGADDARQTVEQVYTQHPGWKIERTSCLGLCDRPPGMLISEQQAGPFIPGNTSGITRGGRGQATDYSQPRKGEMRVMMANAGMIDPDSLSSAMEHGAYLAWKDTR